MRHLSLIAASLLLAGSSTVALAQATPGGGSWRGRLRRELRDGPLAHRLVRVGARTIKPIKASPAHAAAVPAVVRRRAQSAEVAPAVVAVPEVRRRWCVGGLSRRRWHRR
jgi:hypothetical protein